MTRALRAGLIGLGMMGRNHARVLGSLDGVELVGILEPSGPKQHAEVPVVAAIDDLLALGVDYCVLAAPTMVHAEIGHALAEAGVHALIEKPLTADPDSARQLVAAFELRGLVGAVGHIERYNPALRSLRARIAAGELGEIYQIATRRQGPFPARVSDVGVVKDLASHDIDLTAWVAQQRVVSVAARTAHKSGRTDEDLVAVVGVLEGGIIASHLVNWLSPMKERVTVVTGERGSFVADTLTADLTFFANGVVPTEWDAIAKFRGVAEGDVTRYAIPKPEPLRTEHEQFRDAILGEASDIVTMREGLATVVVAEAILYSARTGTTCEIGGSS